MFPKNSKNIIISSPIYYTRDEKDASSSASSRLSESSLKHQQQQQQQQQLKNRSCNGSDIADDKYPPQDFPSTGLSLPNTTMPTPSLSNASMNSSNDDLINNSNLIESLSSTTDHNNSNRHNTITRMNDSMNKISTRYINSLPTNGSNSQMDAQADDQSSNHSYSNCSTISKHDSTHEQTILNSYNSTTPSSSTHNSNNNNNNFKASNKLSSSYFYSKSLSMSRSLSSPDPSPSSSTSITTNNNHHILTQKQQSSSSSAASSSSSSTPSLSPRLSLQTPQQQQQGQGQQLMTKEAKMLKIDDMILQLNQFTPEIRHEIFSLALENEYIKVKTHASLLSSSLNNVVLPFHSSNIHAKLDVIIDRLEANTKTILAREERRHQIMMEKEIRFRKQQETESLRILHQQECESKRIQFEYEMEMKRLHYQIEKDKYDQKFWGIFIIIIIAIIACFIASPTIKLFFFPSSPSSL